MLPFLLFVALLASSLGYAFWRGGSPERVVAASLSIAWITSMLVEPWAAMRFQSTMIPTLIIDAVLAALLMVVALTANRHWTMAATSLQIIIVLAHLVKMFRPELLKVVYMLMVLSWPYLQLLLLLAGTGLHTVRLKANGTDRSWSSSSVLWPDRGPRKLPTN